MRTNRLDRFAALALAAVLGGVLFGATGTRASFVVSTAAPGNTFTSIPDWKPPLISSAAVLKTEGGIPGYVRTGATYTVLANVVDDPSSNPPAGIASVQTNVSTLTTTASALALTAGATTAGGQVYTHKSATQTVAAGKVASTYSSTVVSRDSVTPPNTSAAFPFNTVVDNTAPSGSGVTVTNGGIVNRPDNGDTVTFTYNEPIDPTSIIAGWDGSAPQIVTVQVTNKGNGDSIYIFNSANTAQLPLGVIALKTTDYVTSSTTFGGPGNATRSTMTWDLATSSVTVKLGPADAAGTVNTTASTTSQMIWTPQSSVFDRAGNLCTTTAWTQITATRKF
jgi:hypothetical protein